MNLTFLLLMAASTTLMTCDDEKQRWTELSSTQTQSPETTYQSIAEVNSEIDASALNEYLTQTIYVGGQPVQIFTEAELNQVVEDLDFVRTKVAELHGRAPVLTHSPLFDDTLFSPAQAAELADTFKSPKERTKREIVSSIFNLWPSKIIYYTTWNSSLSTEIQNLIEQAVAYYSQHTCLTLQYFDMSSTPPAIHYLLFTGNASGCWSNTGFTASGAHIVNLQSDSCDRIGVVQHEIGHALGLFHEQARKDRDSFVQIIWDNVLTHKLNNFKVCSSCIDADYPYDFGSMMHYFDNIFAINGSRKTIEVIDPRYQKTMGYQFGPMTFYDLKVLNTQYCSVKIPSNGPQIHPNPCTGINPCMNEGYLNPANCNQCICPEPYNPATKCQTRHPGTLSECGGDFTGSTIIQIFTSPGWPSSGQWDGFTCVYIVKCNPGSKIHYGFSEFHFLPFIRCVYQWVEIRDENLINTGPRYCGTTNPTPSGGWRSHSNTVILILKDVQDKYRSLRGFQFYYRCVESETTTAIKTTTTATTTPTTSCSTTPITKSATSAKTGTSRAVSIHTQKTTNRCKCNRRYKKPLI